MSKNPVTFDRDNPEWTEEDFVKAKRGEAMPEWVFDAFPKTKRGRPAGSRGAVTKEQVTVRLDRAVLEKLRAGGPGWQTRMNEALRTALKIR